MKRTVALMTASVIAMNAVAPAFADGISIHNYQEVLEAAKKYEERTGRQGGFVRGKHSKNTSFKQFNGKMGWVFGNVMHDDAVLPLVRDITKVMDAAKKSEKPLIVASNHWLLPSNPMLCEVAEQVSMSCGDFTAEFFSAVARDEDGNWSEEAAVENLEELQASVIQHVEALGVQLAPQQDQNDHVIRALEAELEALKLEAVRDEETIAELREALNELKMGHTVIINGEPYQITEDGVITITEDKIIFKVVTVDKTEYINEGLVVDLTEYINEGVVVDLTEYINEGIIIDKTKYINEGVIVDLTEYINEDKVIDLGTYINEGETIDLAVYINEGLTIDLATYINDGAVVDLTEYINKGVVVDLTEYVNEGVTVDLTEYTNEGVTVDLTEYINEGKVIDLTTYINEGVEVDLTEYINEGVTIDLTEYINEGVVVDKTVYVEHTVYTVPEDYSLVLSSSITDLETKISDLEATKTANELKISALETTIAAMNDAENPNSLSSLLSTANLNIEQLNADITAKEQEIAEKTAQIANLQQLLSTEEGKHEITKGLLTAEKAKVDQLVIDLAAAKDAHQAAIDELAEVRDELDALKQEAVSIDEVEYATTQMAELQEAINLVVTNRDYYQEQMNKFQQKSQELQADLEAESVKLAEAVTTIGELEDDIAELKETIKQKDVTINAKNIKIGQLNTQIEQINSAWSAAQEEIFSLQNDLVNMENLKNGLQTNLDKALEKLDEAKDVVWEVEYLGDFFSNNWADEVEAEDAETLSTALADLKAAKTDNDYTAMFDAAEIISDLMPTLVAKIVSNRSEQIVELKNSVNIHKNAHEVTKAAAQANYDAFITEFEAWSSQVQSLDPINQTNHSNWIWEVRKLVDGEIQDLETSIASLNSIIDNKDDIISGLQDSVAYWKGEYDQKVAEYIAQTESDAAKLAEMDQLILEATHTIEDLEADISVNLAGIDKMLNAENGDVIAVGLIGTDDAYFEGYITIGSHAPFQTSDWDFTGSNKLQDVNNLNAAIEDAELGDIFKLTGASSSLLQSMPVSSNGTYVVIEKDGEQVLKKATEGFHVNGNTLAEINYDAPTGSDDASGYHSNYGLTLSYTMQIDGEDVFEISLYDGWSVDSVNVMKAINHIDDTYYNSYNQTQANELEGIAAPTFSENWEAMMGKLEEVVEQLREDAYTHGYEDGHEDGYEEGYVDGYATGWSDAKLGNDYNDQ